MGTRQKSAQKTEFWPSGGNSMRPRTRQFFKHQRRPRLERTSTTGLPFGEGRILGARQAPVKHRNIGKKPFVATQRRTRRRFTKCSLVSSRLSFFRTRGKIGCGTSVRRSEFPFQRRWEERTNTWLPVSRVHRRVCDAHGSLAIIVMQGMMYYLITCRAGIAACLAVPDICEMSPSMARIMGKAPW